MKLDSTEIHLHLRHMAKPQWIMKHIKKRQHLHTQFQTNVIKNLFLICLLFVIMQIAVQLKDSATSKELVIGTSIQKIPNKWIKNCVQMRHTCFISYILQAELRLNTHYEAARNKVRNIWPGGHIQSTHTPVTTTEVNANFTKI